MGHSKIQYQGARRRQTVNLLLGGLHNYVIPYFIITPFTFFPVPSNFFLSSFFPPFSFFPNVEMESLLKEVMG
jgi:hypothetical protein